MLSSEWGHIPLVKYRVFTSKWGNSIIRAYGWMEVETTLNWGHIPSSEDFLDYLRVRAHPIIGAHGWMYVGIWGTSHHWEVFFAASEWEISHQCGVWTNSYATKYKALNSILFS